MGTVSPPTYLSFLYSPSLSVPLSFSPLFYLIMFFREQEEFLQFFNMNLGVTRDLIAYDGYQRVVDVKTILFTSIILMIIVGAANMVFIFFFLVLFSFFYFFY